MASTERLQKVLAHAGVASRRHAELLIQEGRVCVNGAVVTQLGVQVDPETDRVEVDGVPVQVQRGSLTYLLLNKPRGVVSTAHDPQGRPTVVELVRSPARVYPVGRLDADSEGLVLLTDDGALTYRLTHARYGVDKEYQALVECAGDPARFRQLAQGVSLEDGIARAVAAGVLRETREGTWVRVVMHEGRKREVRRMLQAIGCPVLRLIRTRLGTLTLGELRPGDSRPLTPGEVNELCRAAGLDR